MRKIKFRAWGQHTKTMIPADDEEFWEQVSVAALHSGTGSLIYMQFTGLRDSVGTEVYEGDILDADPGYNGQMRPVSIEDPHGYRFMFGKDVLCRANANNGLVVGNVYQNPEILEVIK